MDAPPNLIAQYIQDLICTVLGDPKWLDHQEIDKGRGGAKLTEGCPRALTFDRSH